MKVSARQKCTHCGAVYKVEDNSEKILKEIEKNGHSVVTCNKCGWDFKILPKK